MTTSSRKNFNYLALRGNKMDDMELVEHYGLSPDLAYTKDLVPALMEINERNNKQHFLDEGLNESEATTRAKENRMAAERDYKELLAKNGMLK